MKTHGLLFKAEMIRAFLRPENPKRQTRRLVTASNSLINCISGRTAKGQRLWETLDWPRASAGFAGKAGFLVFKKNSLTEHLIVQPLINAGDEFYAKETFRSHLCDGRTEETIHYLADSISCPIDGTTIKPWRPSIFMSPSASRITGTFKQVRAQRVNQISEDDAKAEGIECPGCLSADHHRCVNAVDAYRTLWDSINTDPGTTWQDNPPVWAYTLSVTNP